METKKKTTMTNKEVYNEYKRIMNMVGLAIKEEEEEDEIEKYKESLRPALRQLKAMQEMFVEEMGYTEEEAKEMIKLMVIETAKNNIK